MDLQYMNIYEFEYACEFEYVSNIYVYVRTFTCVLEGLYQYKYECVITIGYFLEEEFI